MARGARMREGYWKLRLRQAGCLECQASLGYIANSDCTLRPCPAQGDTCQAGQTQGSGGSRAHVGPGPGLHGSPFLLLLC